ncbi:PAS domain S-box protein [Simiduia curdlanivorans]|uniref:histidine kinase n=1 Tax=Simiduia curdlanivorans TaxID=1492769 RepID=A0ABV8V3P3_9GAMM|nr:PAS domain S-box protein [Simiduia curdlanivorans]MDN3637640.1 PAS domain S-box protein [Simiduia curdlanivorans]
MHEQDAGITINLSAGSHQDDVMRLAVEASPNGMVMIDIEGRIVLVNSAVESLFGHPREALIGQPIEQLVPERYRSQHPHLRQQFFTQPQSRAMGHGRELYGLHRDGTEFPVEIGLNPINTAEGVLVLAAIVDITERRRAQEMIRLAVEAAPNGMLMTDAEGKITLVNSMAEIQFGYAREELIGRDITLLVPDRFKANHPGLRHNYYTHPVSRAMGKGRDLYARHRNGSEFPVEIGLNPIKTLQGMMILASVVDITERKRQEESLKATLREKEVMLSEIHHRVKNNLQIIDSLIAMQLGTMKDSKAISLLLDSQSRIKSMAMIHQTLYQSHDFSRVDIAKVTRQLVDNLAQSYGVNNNSGIRLSTEIDDIFLTIDVSIPLGLIINELVSNAMKHAFPKNRTGTIDVALKRIDDSQIRLSVVDNGIGIAHKLQGQPSESLGLRLVESLTDQLDGSLEIKPEAPTRFDIQFPG